MSYRHFSYRSPNSLWSGPKTCIGGSDRHTEPVHVLLIFLSVSLHMVCGYMTTELFVLNNRVTYFVGNNFTTKRLDKNTEDFRSRTQNEFCNNI